MTSASPATTTAARQAAVLFGGFAASLVVAAVAGAPFDIDVGAGHAVFHLVFGAGLAVVAAWLWRHRRPGRPPSCVLARWSSAALAGAAVIEGIAAIPAPEGDGAAHEIPNVVSLAVLQPLVLLAVVALVVSALQSRRRRRTTPR